MHDMLQRDLRQYYAGILHSHVDDDLGLRAYRLLGHMATPTSFVLLVVLPSPSGYISAVSGGFLRHTQPVLSATTCT